MDGSQNQTAKYHVSKTRVDCSLTLFIFPSLQMTNSELHVVMTGGFATIAGGVLVKISSINFKTTKLDRFTTCKIDLVKRASFCHNK